MKKLLATMLALVMVLSVCPLGAVSFSASAATATSGTTGDCTWQVDGTKLTIVGSGEMEDYYSGGPWEKTITEVVIESGVTSIGEAAFYRCSKLESISIPDTVTSIGRYVFYNCDALKTVAIPNSVTSIGDYAFEYCQKLESITIPSSVTKIGEDVFSRCDALKSLTVASDNKVYHSSGNCLIETASKTLLKGCNSSVIPTDGSVISIGDCAFQYCQSLENITIPNSVISIGDSAFYNCESLKSIAIPKSVISIGTYAFGACSGLTSFTVVAGNPMYHSNGNCLIETASKTLLQGCNNSVIPTDGSIASIGEDAFAYCSDLTIVSIPDGVKSIANRAFYRCSNLASITIPDSVTSIGSYVFYITKYYQNSSKWKNGMLYIGNHLIEAKRSVISADCTIKSGTLTIAGSAFYDCNGLKSVTIPDSVVSIGEYAFSGCQQLESITIPDKVTSIGNCSFKTCTTLNSINIPDSVTSIGYDTFYNTAYYKDSSNWENGVLYIGKHLIAINSDDIPKSYSIKNGTLTIADSAFLECSSIESVTIPESVTSICDYAFGGCTALTSITVAAGNKVYHSSGNCIIETASKTLVQGCNNSVIPTDGSVTSIGEFAFIEAIGLRNITIPNSVTNIGYGAFGYCIGLKSITIPSSVTSIGVYAFAECSDDLVIYGKTGSYVADYATLNGIQFECAHFDWVLVGKKSATCSAEGYTGDKKCKECSLPIESGKVTPIDKNNHSGSTKLVGKKAATCTAAGYTGDTKCTVCVTVTAKGKAVAATGHKTKTVVTKATTKANGKAVTTCTVCKKVTKTVTINKIASVKLSATKYIYSGKAKTPSVVVKDSKGKTLKKGTDYTVTYASGRKNVGKYTVKVTFKGNYSGSKSLSFTIVPKSTKLDKVTAGSKKLTVKWDKQATQTSGYQVQYSTSKSFKSAKTVTVSGAKKTSKTIKSLKAKKTYYVRVRTYKTIGSTKYYSAWSSATSAKPKK